MCGLVGYIGEGAEESVLESLKNLEYRGYDSAGIVIKKNNEIDLYKSVGEVEKLKNIINTNAPIKINRDKSVKNINNSKKNKQKPQKHMKFQLALGHNRWATHGKICEENVHPHYSQDKNFYVVHNGIIENYFEIKRDILNNVNFYGETDTEVIPNLIEKYYNGDMLNTLKIVIKLLKGSYCFAVLYKKENKIYFARKNNPMIIGKGKNIFMLASDIVGLDRKCQEFYILPNNVIGCIEKNNIYVEGFLGDIIIPLFKQLSINNINENKEFEHFMLQEIYQIPMALKNTLGFYRQENNCLSKIPLDYFNIDSILLIGCGTSYHSCLVGKKILEKNLPFPVSVEMANEYVYNKSNLTPKCLAIILSQSGETADCLTAVKQLKENNVKTISITNVETSSIAYACDYCLPIKAGREKAVASTKAYNTQILMFDILEDYLCKNLYKIKGLKKEKFAKLNKNSINFEENVINLANFENQINKIDILKLNKDIKNIADFLTSYKNIYVIGRDYDYVSALELSLKIKEISYIPTYACPAGELKHGTLALIDSNAVVLFIITERHMLLKNIATINEIKSRGGKIVALTIFEKSNFENCDLIFDLNCSEEISHIASIIPMQLLAYNMSLRKGNNPDKPRNLAKSVTVE